MMGTSVVNRLSVNALLKTVIVTLAAAIVIALALGALESWRRLTAVNRIAAVAEVTAHIVTALHNLHVDRTSSLRDLSADRQFTAIDQQIKDARAGEMAALKSAAAALEVVDFPERAAMVAGLNQSITRLAVLHEESVTALLKPKAERRPGLTQEIFNETNGLLDTLDKLSTDLTRLVKLADAFVDQLLEI